MATSQNGWSASPNLKTRPLVVAGESFSPGIRNNDDVYTVLKYVAEQMNARVEPIEKAGWHQADDWGYYYRANKNDPNSLSNHSSGTAIDYNATRHPNGVPASKTYTAKQIAEIHKILAEVDHVVRWGGDYTRTVDAMHFEINANAAAVAKVAARLRKPPMPAKPVKTTPLVLALGNIRSTPRMTVAQEQQATRALFAFADRIGAHAVIGNEIDHPSLRRTWRAMAKGFLNYGCKPGSENVVSVRGWKVGSAFVRWLSNGVAKVTPTRRITVVNLTVDGLKVKIIATHLVSQWQPYAKAKAGKTWNVRASIASRSVARLKKRVDNARKAGMLVIFLGDVNALTNLKITDGQVQLLGTGKAAGGNLGKMLQAAAFPPAGMSVKVTNRWRGKPVATDHPYRGVRFEVGR